MEHRRKQRLLQFSGEDGVVKLVVTPEPQSEPARPRAGRKSPFAGRPWGRVAPAGGRAGLRCDVRTRR